MSIKDYETKEERYDNDWCIHNHKTYLKKEVIEEITKELGIREKQWEDILDIKLNKYSCIQVIGENWELKKIPYNMGKVAYYQEGHSQKELWWEFEENETEQKFTPVPPTKAGPIQGKKPI